MIYSRLFSVVVLCPQIPDQLDDILRILDGTASVGEIASLRDQDDGSQLFDGDGDVLILSYAGPNHLEREPEAARILGDDINNTFQHTIIPFIKASHVPVELVVRYCNLSTETVIQLANAIRVNDSLVGFHVHNNPGNCEVGMVALKYACIQSPAPIKWYRGTVLDEDMTEQRHEFMDHGLREDSDDEMVRKSDHQRAGTEDSTASSSTPRSSPIEVVYKSGSRSPINDRSSRRSSKQCSKG